MSPLRARVSVRPGTPNNRLGPWSTTPTRGRCPAQSGADPGPAATTIAALGVERLQARVAPDADDRKVVEFSECLGQLLFTKEHLLASITPRLQIVRVRAVLDETEDRIGRSKQMRAHDRSRTRPVDLAVDRRGLLVRIVAVCCHDLLIRTRQSSCVCIIQVMFSPRVSVRPRMAECTSLARGGVH